MAEAIFNSMVEKSNLPNFITSYSVGTSDYHLGEEPDFRTLEICQKNNIKIHHIAAKINPVLIKSHDIILAMDTNILAEIKEMVHKNSDCVVSLIRQYDEYPFIGLDVPDPYYGSINDFEEVYSILDRCCSNLLKSIT